MSSNTNTNTTTTNDFAMQNMGPTAESAAALSVAGSAYVPHVRSHSPKPSAPGDQQYMAPTAESASALAAAGSAYVPHVHPHAPGAPLQPGMNVGPTAESASALAAAGSAYVPHVHPHAPDAPLQPGMNVGPTAESAAALSVAGSAYVPHFHHRGSTPNSANTNSNTDSINAAPAPIPAGAPVISSTTPAHVKAQQQQDISRQIHGTADGPSTSILPAGSSTTNALPNTNRRGSALAAAERHHESPYRHPEDAISLAIGTGAHGFITHVNPNTFGNTRRASQGHLPPVILSPNETIHGDGGYVSENLRGKRVAHGSDGVEGARGELDAQGQQGQGGYFQQHQQQQDPRPTPL